MITYGLALLVVAIGIGLSMPALSTGIVTSLPPAQAGMESGLHSAVREIGSAVVGTVLTSRFASGLQQLSKPRRLHLADTPCRTTTRSRRPR
jgi:hypothetical protein